VPRILFDREKPVASAGFVDVVEDVEDDDDEPSAAILFVDIVTALFLPEGVVLPNICCRFVRRLLASEFEIPTLLGTALLSNKNDRLVGNLDDNDSRIPRTTIHDVDNNGIEVDMGPSLSVDSLRGRDAMRFDPMRCDAIQW